MPEEDFISCVVTLDSLKRSGLRCDFVSSDKSTKLALAAVRVYGCLAILCGVHIDRAIKDWCQAHFTVNDYQRNDLALLNKRILADIDKIF
eukprot:Nk52_evm4s1916 gene=Nk52_evmTU4s1916